MVAEEVELAEQHQLLLEELALLTTAPLMLLEEPVSAVLRWLELILVLAVHQEPRMAVEGMAVLEW